MGIREAFARLRRAPKHYTLKEPQAFFGHVRRITNKLDQVQVDTINELLSQASHWPLAYMAYGLATAWHEARLKPIKEIGGDRYFHLMYDIKGNRPAKARELGNLTPGDGIKYAGRGLPQITGRTNYAKASKALGVDFVTYPDKVLDPKHAVAVMVWGMDTGSFTGKSLADYLPKTGPGNVQDFTKARRIINGTDRALKIADHALDFQEALEAGGWS